MELKMFGPGGVPDIEFTRQLGVLFSVDASAWDEVAAWFLSTQSFDERDDSSAQRIAASSLLPQQFFDCVSAFRFILEAWQMHSLRILDILRDLFALDYPEHLIDRLGEVLGRLEPLRERVYTRFMRFEHENAILPALEDIDVVCDIRPVFEDYVFPAPTTTSGVSYKKLVGFSYMVLVELLTEDIEGKTRKLAFQLTEESLSDLQGAFARAREQLDILKKSTRAIVPE